MNVEVFLKSNLSQPREFKQLVGTRQRRENQVGLPVSKANIMGNLLIDTGKAALEGFNHNMVVDYYGNVVDLSDHNNSASHEMLTNIDRYMVDQHTSIFLGTMVKHLDNGLVNGTFSVRSFVADVNRVTTGTSVTSLPVPGEKFYDEVFNGGKWRSMVDMAKGDKSLASLIGDLDFLPDSLREYILLNKDVTDLYVHLQKSGMLKAYKDLARAAMYEPIPISEKDAVWGKRFTRTMRGSLQRFLADGSLEKTDKPLKRDTTQDRWVSTAKTRRVVKSVQEFLEETRKGKIPLTPEELKAFFQEYLDAKEEYERNNEGKKKSEGEVLLTASEIYDLCEAEPDYDEVEEFKNRPTAPAEYDRDYKSVRNKPNLE